MDDVILIERPKPGLAVVTLNRPAAMNALSHALRSAIVETMRTLDAEGVRVLVLTGAGRAFCAGLDLKEMSRDLGALDVNAENPVVAVRDFPGVVIGAINGVAITGGFELALACDILIASCAARFADTHLRVGMIPGWGLSQILSRTIGIYRARQISLSGRYVSAAQAESWGIVGEVVPEDRLLDAARALAEELLGMPEKALRSYKTLIDDGYQRTFDEAIVMEAARNAAHNLTITPGAIADRRERVQQHGKDQLAHGSFIKSGNGQDQQ